MLTVLARSGKNLTSEFASCLGEVGDLPYFIALSERRIGDSGEVIGHGDRTPAVLIVLDLGNLELGGHGCYLPLMVVCIEELPPWKCQGVPKELQVRSEPHSPFL